MHVHMLKDTHFRTRKNYDYAQCGTDFKTTINEKVIRGTLN